MGLVASRYGTEAAGHCSETGVISLASLAHHPNEPIRVDRMNRMKQVNQMNQMSCRGVWQVYGEGERIWLAE